MTGRVLRNPEVAWREEPAERDSILEALEAGEDASGRGWVIVVDGGQMHELNLLAGEIWLLADGSRDCGGIAAALAEVYEAPFEEILADVQAFVAEGAEKGWLRLEEDR